MAEAKNYDKFNYGIQDSRYKQNGFFDLENVDIFSETGAGMNANAMKAEVGSPTEPCFQAVNSNGEIYLFSTTTGSIWRRGVNGTISKVNTNPNGGHKGCYYYRGRMYFATNQHLGSVADDGTDWKFNIGFEKVITTKAGEANGVLVTSGLHAMAQFDYIFYICDGNNIASMDDTGTYTTSTLDLPWQYTAVALLQYGDDLLILANSAYIADSKIFRWDTYSGSWSVADSIKEPVFTFIDADNYVFAVANSGQIYQFDGRKLSPVFKLPEYSSMNHQLAANYLGKAYVAHGKRIYAIHRKSINDQFAISCEFTLPHTIKSMRASAKTFLISTDGGMYNIDFTKRAVARVTTPLAIGKFKRVEIGYFQLTGTDTITVEVNEDNQGWVLAESERDAEDENIISITTNVSNHRYLQARVTLTAKTSAPVIIDSIKFIT